MPWLEAFGVVCLAVLGYGLGIASSKLAWPWWPIGWGAAVCLAVMLALTRWVPSLEFVFPFSVLVSGRSEFGVLAFDSTLLIGSLIGKVERRLLKFLLLFLMLLASGKQISEFVLPTLQEASLRALKTTVDGQGVCIQSTGYTCAPAAAVTVLRSFGIQAEEGDLAVRAKTTSSGTMLDLLSNAIFEAYSDQGITSEYRTFKTLDELQRAGPTLASVKFGPFEDHCVAVLSMHSNQVNVADPLCGMRILPREEFLSIWRYSGVVISKSPER